MDITHLLTAAVSESQTPHGCSIAVGLSFIQRCDVVAANRAVDEHYAVSAAEAQRALKRYVIDGRRVSLTYMAEASAATPPAPAAPASAA